MDSESAMQAESDRNFPGGPWTGFFLQCWRPGRHTMNIDLRFTGGELDAQGSDFVGPFTFRGSYDVTDGKCKWVKQYLGRHSVTYSGVNEGQGIWGVWEIRQLGGLFRDKGVFHIWPQGMTPTEEAEATVQAYLEHQRTLPGRVTRIWPAMVSLLLVGFFVATWVFKILLHIWLILNRQH